MENVELRLFQEGRPIQMVNVRVPRATPKATPIRMRVVMHENYAITVEGTIGDTPYQASVQLPSDRDMPTPEAATDLTRRFQEGLAALSAGQRATASAQLKVARHAFDEARGDVDQATHEFDQMRRLVDALGKGQGELRPPKAEFDKLVEDCRERHAQRPALICTGLSARNVWPTIMIVTSFVDRTCDGGPDPAPCPACPLWCG
ncbi:hypothetical protein ACIBKZ_35095 [Streptomyces sp. NPDC050421]|uniref:hypothetical protein n=1 Tax=Streptomyces sp. NPDC050421 TaxID=3365613 RepID=UPI003795E34B